MDFIKKWSYGCASYLMTQLNENHEKRGVYYYGFQVVIGGLVKAVSLILISLLTRSLIPSLIIIVIFGALRMLAGGNHMDSYGSCIATSMALFVISSVLDQYALQYLSYNYILLIIALVFVVSIAALIRWAPADNPNRPITKPEEIKKFKILTIVYIIAWLILTMVLMNYKINNYKLIIVAGCLGVILEIFTITPLGYAFFNLIKGKLNKTKKRKRQTT